MDNSHPRRACGALLGMLALAFSVSPRAAAIVPVIRTAAFVGVDDYRGPHFTPEAVFLDFPGDLSVSPELVFAGTITPTFDNNTKGIWTRNSPVALDNHDGAYGPNLGRGVHFESFFPDPQSGGSVSVLFGGTLAGPGVDSTNDQVYSLRERSDTRTLIRTGSAYKTLYSGKIDPFNVVIHAEVVSPATQEALAREDRSYIPGAFFRFARTGVTGIGGPQLGIPELVSQVFDNDGGATRAFEQYQLRERHIAFVAKTSAAGSGDPHYGIWRFNSRNSLNEAAVLSGVTGALGPGLGVGVFANHLQTANRIQFDLNSQGHLAFFNTLVDGRDGLWRNLGQSNEPVMLAGETGRLGPGLGPTDVFINFATSDRSVAPSFNAAGDILFPGLVEGTTPREGLWLNRNRANRPIALTGDDGLNGPALGPGVTFSRFHGAHFVEYPTQSVVFFTADLSTLPSSTHPHGLWMYADGAIQPVLVFDQVFDVDTTGSDDLRTVAWVQTPNEMSAVRGQFGFRAGFQDGSIGVFELSLIPEPASVLLAATAVLPLASRRRAKKPRPAET